MGKQKHLIKIEYLFNNSPVVSFNSIKRIVESKKNTGYAKQIVRNLEKQGKIKSISKGHYTKYDDPSLSVFCFKPAYLGLQSALSMHNLWEQETVPIIISASKVRPGIRKLIETNVIIRRINKKYFFGFETYEDGFYLPYSDIEKTLIDMIVYKEKITQETLINIKKKLDKKKLNSYLKEYPEIIKKKVLNLII
jgi:predicted transcriptional regulator of viral defense system